ncbi:MAG: aldo/keto reductase [Muribaculaceae bacterium]|nr:aldo/keto reductase [Muribaculaceae bacterium]
MEKIKLNNGVEMPLIGYGVFQVSPEECEKCVCDALSVGYRSIDTAQAYFNEEGVGNAWKKSGVKREEIFLTTKVWITNAGDKKAGDSIDTSLKKLQTDYIDLLLIHQPFGDYYGTYRAMERALKDGKVRAIGVSNFYYDRFEDLADNMEIKPAVNQLEVNVFSRQKRMQEICSAYGAHLMAWGPLVQGGNGIFTNPVLEGMGAKYGKTAAQVALRFLVQSGIIVIPKSVRIERMKENLEILDFTLSNEEMKEISKLDTGHGIAADFTDKEQLLGLYHLLKNLKV